MIHISNNNVTTRNATVPSKDVILREKTFKEEGMETERRVFYTLTNDDKLASHRNSKAIALLIKLLEEKGLINESDIDELLLEAIH